MAKRKLRGHGEGSVYQRKDGRWVAEITLEDHSRKQFYGKSKKEVQEKLRQAIHQQKQGILVTGSQQTMGQFLEYWLEEVHRRRIRIGTYVSYRAILDKHLLPALGHVLVQKLTAQHIQKLYAQKLEEGLSSGRVLNIHAVLHKALDHAVRINLVIRNVSDSVELPRLEQREIQPLTAEQAQRFLAVVRERRLEALLTLALVTGMRKGELLGLKWQDIDLEEGSLQVRRTVGFVTGRGFVEGETKTKSSKRKIMLPRFVLEMLKRHRTLQLEARLKAGTRWIDRDLVFCSIYGGFLHPMTVFDHFTSALNDAGLPRMRFHDLRHSAATLLLSMGVPAKVVQEILGHSRISMTLGVYSHVLPGMQQEAMEKMDDLFRQQS